jgi:hypothetical protein
MTMLLARIRMPLVYLALLWLILGPLLGVPWWIPLTLFLIALAVYFRVGAVRREPITVAPPVAGRWRALNSPADRVPSHGLHAYGQTYAIDLLYAAQSDAEVDVEWWPLTRPTEAFPGFGQPVVAPIRGEVIRVYDRARDHRSRTSWPALVYMLTIGAVIRELRGPRGILGNHVVIRGDDCVYALVAHLERGSALVDVGSTVDCGTPIASCGNSGNTSEPHVHFQLMDRPSTLVAAGLPFRFDHYEVDGTPAAGVPSHAKPFVTSARNAGLRRDGSSSR